MPNDKKVTLLALPYVYKNIAVPKELMIDYDNGLLYIKSIRGTRDIEIGKNNIIDNIINHIRNLISGVSADGNTLNKIRLLIKDVEDWKKSLEINDPHNVIERLMELFKNLENLDISSSTLIELIDNKIDHIWGKGLTTNDFTLEYKQKIELIESNANHYIHPGEKVCNYTPSILSVNGQTGNVVINKNNIGLSTLDNNANCYIHPEEQQCSATFVRSVNGMDGAVILDKTDIGLNNVLNYFPYNYNNRNKVEEMYMTPEGLEMLFENIRDIDFTEPLDSFLINPMSSGIKDFVSGIKYTLNKLKRIIVNFTNINGDNDEYIEISKINFGNIDTTIQPNFPDNCTGTLNIANKYFNIQFGIEDPSIILSYSLNNNSDWTLEEYDDISYRLYPIVYNPIPLQFSIYYENTQIKVISIENIDGMYVST